MPTYALICADAKCGHVLDEIVARVAERDLMVCPTCGGVLTNDYVRHSTSHFQLKGNDWPTKTMKLESHILKNGLKD